MTTSVRVRAKARLDLKRAADWYEAQQPGLGGEFVDEVQAVFESIAAYPARHPLVHRGTRRALLRKFPFGVFYRVTGEVAVVVAVMHGSRHPRRWQIRT